MTRAASLLTAPARDQAVGKTDAAAATAPLLAEGLEDLGLADRVTQALRATGYVTLHGIEVNVCGRTIVLAGRVPSYYLKQVALATVQAVSEAHRVCNNLTVGRPD